jgi:hypothetical protein
MTLNVQNFNANNLIPKSSYFSYVGPLPYGTCLPDTNVQYVVFHHKHGSINVGKETMNNLGKLIHDAFIPIHEGKSFFNEKGTIENGFAGDGQIYIDCQPTDEDTEVVYQEPTQSPKYLEWLWSVLFIIIGICLAILLRKIFTAIFSPLKSISKNNVG